jgi:hypothetical protein
MSSVPPRKEVTESKKPPTKQRQDAVPPRKEGPSASGELHREEDPSKDIEPLSESGRDTESGKDFWERMDEHNNEVLGSFKKTFRINSSINIILVIIGTVLIGNAIVYSWIHGTDDGWSIFSGGIGLGALVSIFFYKSQDAISKAAANLAIVDMAFNSNYRAYESITDYDYKLDHGLPHN